MSRAEVTVITAPRETWGYTARALESVYENTRMPFQYVYVDAGSPPWTKRYLAEHARKHTNFRLIRVNKYLYQNQARNLALPYADTDYTVFIDNDVIVAPGWLEALLRCAKETGASIVGPLYCEANPPFQTVHVAQQTAYIEDQPNGRRYVEINPNKRAPLKEVRHLFKREPSGFAEMHCMLVRTEALRRLGKLDEGLRTTHDHVDLCWSVRQNGGTIYFEPEAMVNQLLPRPFPFSVPDLPYYLWRWNPADNRAGIEHFCKKWGLTDKDVEALIPWYTEHRWLVFHYAIVRELVKVRNIVLRRHRRQARAL